MNNDTMIGLVIILAISVALFFILRGINNWYWRINERIAIQHKTNYLLEKISIQLGATDIDKITLEEIATGKVKEVKLDDWIEFNIKNPNTKEFRTVNANKK